MNRFIITIILVVGLGKSISANQSFLSFSKYPVENSIANVKPDLAATECKISFQEVVTDNPNGCSASEDGSICVTINGTISDEFELSINNGSTWISGEETICIEDLPSGNFNLKIRDQGGCEVIYSDNPVVLTVDDSLKITNIDITPQTYSGLGSITVTASGPIPYFYRINGGTWQSSNTFENLSAGTYQMGLMNTGCISVGEATVIDERFPEFTVAKTDETNCSSPNGSITITTSIGIRPLTYSNDNGSTWQSDSVFSNLSGGLYYLAVKGDNACVSYNTTVVKTSFVQFSGSSSVVDVAGCIGDATGEINLAVSGGLAPFQFSIDNGASWQSSGDFTGLIADDYTLIVKDDFACADTSIFTINQPIHDTIRFIMVENIQDCAGDLTGAIAINEGLLMPFMFQEMGSMPTISYSIDGGLSWQASCFFYNLPAGIYTLIKKIDDCEYPYYLNPVIVTEPDPVQFSNIEIAGDNGSDSGEIVITATGGGGISHVYEYSNDGGITFGSTETFSNLPFGDYNLVVKDDRGCTADSTVTVPDESINIVNVDSTDVTGCYGDSNGAITITATAGVGSLLYSIDNGVSWQLSNLFTELIAGSYTIVVKDEAGTSKSYGLNPVSIAEPTELSFSITKKNPACSGTSTGEIKFRSVTGGCGNYSYSIDSGYVYVSDLEFSELEAGSYYAFIKDDNNCVKSYPHNPVVLTDPAPFVIDTVFTFDNSFCNGTNNGSIVIVSNPRLFDAPYSYPIGNSEKVEKVPLTGVAEHYYYSIDNGESWQTDLSEFDNLNGGSYTVLAMNPSNCVAEWKSNPVVISNIEPLVIDTLLINHSNSQTSGQIEVQASGGFPPYTYSIDGVIWQESNVFASLVSGTYNVQVSDSIVCQLNKEATVDTTVYLPDANFKAYLLGNSSINKNGDAEIQISEAISLKPILNVNELEISDMTGIESFINLSYLYCKKNSISSLDLSQNTKIISLNCSENLLTDLNLDNNTALTSLLCSYNSLTELNLDNNTALTSLSCYNNSLTELNLDNNTVLTSLSCWTNSLTNLDLSKNTSLSSVKCSSNPLTELDLSKNTLLTTVSCYSDSLTELDLSKNTLLTNVSCYSNSLTELDLSKNTLLTTVSCYSNSLTELDLSKNSSLTILNCRNNQLSLLNLQNGNNSNVTTISCTNNPDLTCVSVDDVSYSETNWASKFDTGVTFSLDCGSTIPEDKTILDTSYDSDDVFCFGAYQTITVAGDGDEVNCLSGSSLTLIAGSSIRFLPGFHAHEGSYVNAYITSDNSFCDEPLGSPLEITAISEKSLEIELLDSEEPKIEISKTMKIYPNPNNGQFTIELADVDNTTVVHVFNAVGGIVYHSIFQKETKQEIDLSQITKGIYFVSANNGKEQHVQKIIIN